MQTSLTSSAEVPTIFDRSPRKHFKITMHPPPHRPSVTYIFYYIKNALLSTWEKPKRYKYDKYFHIPKDEG